MAVFFLEWLASLEKEQLAGSDQNMHLQVAGLTHYCFPEKTMSKEI
jgi:hypothetical protein